MKNILYYLLLLTIVSCTPKYKELYISKSQEYEILKKKYEKLNDNYITEKDERIYLRDQYKSSYYENENLKTKIDSLNQVILKKCQGEKPNIKK